MAREINLMRDTHPVVRFVSLLSPAIITAESAAVLRVRGSTSFQSDHIAESNTGKAVRIIA